MNWRKCGTALFLTVLLVLCLSACQNEKRVEGLVVEVQTNADGDLTAFVVENSGERTGVLIAERTSLWPRGISSGTLEEFRAQFQAELQEDTLANAWCYPRREKLETADGEKIAAYWAQSISIDGVLERQFLTLQDGTAVDMLRLEGWRSRMYRLADGTELLWVDDRMGPGDVIVMDREGFETLNERAQEKVRAYYEEQGLLYDELEELEKSYAAYLELGEEFDCEHVRQEVTPTAASEKVMYFQTFVMLPEEYGTNLYQEISLCAAFDRETGEHIDTWDLFAVPEPEARRRLPELTGWDGDKELAAEMAETLEPEWLVFHQDSVTVEFPVGSLPGWDCIYRISVDYGDAPEGFFQPWAIPKSAEE